MLTESNNRKFFKHFCGFIGVSRLILVTELKRKYLWKETDLGTKVKGMQMEKKKYCLEMLTSAMVWIWRDGLAKQLHIKAEHY